MGVYVYGSGTFGERANIVCQGVILDNGAEGHAFIFDKLLLERTVSCYRKRRASSLGLVRCCPHQRRPIYFSIALPHTFYACDPRAPTYLVFPYYVLCFPMALHYNSPGERPLSRTQSKALANRLRFTNPLHTHANCSTYTLRTIPTNDSDSPTTPTDPLVPWQTDSSQTDPSRNYGSTPTSPTFWPRSPGMPSFRRPLLMNAAIKMAVLFIVSCLFL